ncbi:MAG: winged helix-turn-helix transcriptional regulator [Desulfobacterales bacterium]|nr:winged helix-turn-helix transcriptional regulator [Desulfobacterales bacterium]
MIVIHDLTIDLEGNRIWRNDEEILLGYQEYQVLWALLNNRGRILTHDQLLRDDDWVSTEDSHHRLQVIIYRLRSKVGYSLITTRTGIGYGILV